MPAEPASRWMPRLPIIPSVIWRGMPGAISASTASRHKKGLPPMNAYEQELLRWANAGAHGAPPSPPATRHPGSVAEQRRSRRKDALVERIQQMDLHEMADRARPLNLPPGLTLEQLIQHFGQAYSVIYWDRFGWPRDVEAALQGER